MTAQRQAYSARLPMDDQRDHLMVQVAKAYYELDRTQARIADDLGLTRWQVGKLLTEAKAEGIVRIAITPRIGRTTALEVELQRSFGLRDAVVVPTGEITDPALLTEMVAQAGASYLANLSPRPALLGISWGRTMSAVARALPPGWNPGAHVVLVNGSTALSATNARNAAVAEDFAQAAGGTATLLPVPAIVGRPGTRAALEDDPIVARVLALADAAPVVCFGMGELSENSILVASGYLAPQDVPRLRARGAVGDILGRFITASGQIADEGLDARTIGLPLDALHRKTHAIGIVAGADKHVIAAAALRAGYASVIVTDEATARSLLNTPKEAP